MSVHSCQYPWHWLIVTHDGWVLPCGHGSRPVGNLHQQTVEEVWNGATLQAVRRAILAGEVHEVCRSSDCPYQQTHLVFPRRPESAPVAPEMGEMFDDDYYLEQHPDVRLAVERRQFVSGFEHFARHGHGEGRCYRLTARSGSRAARAANAELAVEEYSRRALVLSSTPVDLVVQVSTICNLSCVMCPHGTGAVDRPHHMPAEIFGRLARFIDRAARMIVSGLGEPMLAPVFWQLIERCVGHEEVFIRANSNALLLTAERAERVVTSGLKEISLSLDAATPRTYTRIRGADFARAVSGVRTMLEARRARPRASLEIFINMTLMRENLAECVAFVELGAKLGVDAVLLSQLFPFGDRPEWRVARGTWEFVYSEQMLNREPALAARQLEAAVARGRDLGVRVILQSNTEAYLAPAAVA